MRTWLGGVFWYLHLTLGMADALGIQNPKQNNEATVWRPGSGDPPSGQLAACRPRPHNARDKAPPHACRCVGPPLWRKGGLGFLKRPTGLRLTEVSGLAEDLPGC